MNKSLVKDMSKRKKTGEKSEILQSLYDEFLKERNLLKASYEDNLSRIEVIDKNILELMQYDDDRQMFSPRVLIGTNSEKIEELKAEKERLDEDNQSLVRKIKYYEAKTEALKKTIIEDPLDEEDSDIVLDKQTVKSMIDKLSYAIQLVNGNPGRCRTELEQLISQLKKL